MTKKIEISLELEVDDNVSEDDISSTIENALAVHKAKAHKFGNLKITTVDKSSADPKLFGYDSRLWEKATCA